MENSSTKEPHIIYGVEKVIAYLEETLKQTQITSQTFFVLIGSRACAAHGIDLGREIRTSDWDVLIPPACVTPFLRVRESLIKDAWARIWPQETFERLPTVTVSVVLHQGEKIEITVLFNFLSLVWDELFATVDAHAPTCKLPTGDECRLAPVTLLHVIKESHLHANINWEKHINDLSVLKKHVTDETRFEKFEKMHKFKVMAATITNNKPEPKDEDITELNLVCQAFTFEGIDLRKEVAYPSNPQYLNFTLGPTTLSRTEFCKSSFETQRSFVVEEAFTIAIHNSLISLFPFNDEVAAKAYKMGLQILCTSANHCNWFTRFIIDNYSNLCSENVRHLYGLVEGIIRKGEDKFSTQPETHPMAQQREYVSNLSEPYLVLHLFEDLLLDDYDSLVTLSLLNKGWNIYFKDHKLWNKWYHKRWGSFAKGTNNTDWRVCYKQRLHIFELRKNPSIPLEKLDQLKQYNQLLQSGARQFLNLRTLMANMALARVRGEIKDLTGAPFAKQLLPHTYIYQSNTQKVDNIGSQFHWMQRRHGAQEVRIEVALIGQSAQPLEFTIAYLDFNATYEYESGDSDYRFDNIQWHCLLFSFPLPFFSLSFLHNSLFTKCNSYRHQIVIEGKDKMKSFKYRSTEAQLSSVLTQAARCECTLVGEEFNCPKMKEGDLLQYLIQLLPPQLFSRFIEAVGFTFGGRR